MKQYYVQRASAGLVITEFTSIANDAITFHREPCIADDAQTAKWKEIVDAVQVDEAKEGVAAGRFDAVAFGTKFLANPDLPARIAAGADLNAPKADLFYTGKVGDLKYTGPEGYTDYPTL
jgi:2,4-dienoyl-CoA reductase-like NADH-dependent reductase (Old Yellow Enzyme family)